MADDERIPLTFDGVTAYFTAVELAELDSFPKTDDGEAFARFAHAVKATFPGSELVPTGPRLTRGRYG